MLVFMGSCDAPEGAMRAWHVNIHGVAVISGEPPLSPGQSTAAQPLSKLHIDALCAYECLVEVLKGCLSLRYSPEADKAKLPGSAIPAGEPG